jgi:hypothetical protein
MLPIKEERLQASQRGLLWLEDQYVENVLSGQHRSRDPYTYEYDGFERDAAAILDLIQGCRLYRRRGFATMESYREHLDRKVEERRAAEKSSLADDGCYVLTDEEFWREVRWFRDGDES